MRYRWLREVAMIGLLLAVLSALGRVLGFWGWFTAVVVICLAVLLFTEWSRRQQIKKDVYAVKDAEKKS